MRRYPSPVCSWQVSLLHFLVAQAQVADASLLDAEEDMPALTRAARVVFAGTADELRRLEAGLRALEVEVESMSRDARDAASAAAAKVGRATRGRGGGVGRG